MISDEEKINILINRLETIEFIIKSFIDHAEEFQNKYILEEQLLDYNAKKSILLAELHNLGGIWKSQ